MAIARVGVARLRAIVAGPPVTTTVEAEAMAAPQAVVVVNENVGANTAVGERMAE